MSGRAALNFLGANLIDATVIDVVSPKNFRPADDVRRHRRPVQPRDRVRHHSVWMTRPELALFEAILWEREDRRAVAVADMALASEVVDQGRMLALLEDGPRGRSRVAEILALAEKRTRSPQETAMRLIWWLDLGLPRPRCNWPIRDADGRIIAEADLLCPELGVVGEYDGGAHAKLRRRARDAAKIEAYRRVGLEPFTLVASDLRNPFLVKQRMLAAVERADPARCTYLIEKDPIWRP